MTVPQPIILAPRAMSPWLAAKRKGWEIGGATLCRAPMSWWREEDLQTLHQLREIT